MHDIEHLPGIFTLGYLGETNFRTIEIDMSAWLDEIPNGVASVIHIRPGESADQAYMAATTFEDGILKWPITALDLGNYDGYGTMQISLHGMDADNHQIGKSENVRTRVNDSATSMSGDIPDAQQSWMDRMTELIDEQRIQKDKIDKLMDGIDRFPVVTYVECGSWYNMLALWFLSNSGQVIPGVTTHDGESYGLSLTKPEGYEPRENDLLMVRMTADLKTPYQLTKYYITFSKDTETYDPVTGRTYVTTGNESYSIDNMNLHYDSDITLFEKNRVYVFRYHSKQTRSGVQYVYDVLNYTPGLKEAAELAETALTEAQAIINGNVVRYDRPQSLTYEQKSQFRDNIGAAELLGGKIPASQLPSYVDDILEYSSLSAFPATGESGKIYVTLDTNLTYRWTGSTYVEVSQSLALGETAQTAFPGDRGLAVETEVENRAKVLYAECTEIVTNPAGWRRICVSVPEGYSPKSGDYLAVKFPATNEIANPPHRYALHYNFHGAVITEDVTVMNLAQDKFDAGTVVFEADSIYLFRHIDEDECQIVGYRVGQALGDTAGTAFPGERGKAVEDAIDGLDERFDEKANATDVEALIKVQDTQPEESANKAWIKETPDEEVQIPTVAEMETGLAGKINKPAVNGTAGQILRTDGAGGTSWENPATAEEIAAATDTWLQENITNPSNPPLDRSLSLENAAAPADMVGDLKSAIANVVESAAPYVISNVTNFVADDWELGGINATGGEFNATYIMRTKYFYPYNPNCTYTWAGRTSDATVRWTFFYDSDLNYIARDNSQVIPIRDDAMYLRFAYGYASNSGVTIDSTIKATLAAAFGFDVTPSSDIIAKGRNNLRIDDDLVICNHSAIVFETAKTYLNVAFDPNDRLAYSEGIGLFQPNVRNESNLKCISCSQFVQAILSGISYNFSRYVLSVNEPAEWGFLSGYYGEIMTDYGDYLTTNEMGLFFGERNQLHELNPASPQAKVGDLLLFNNGESFYHCAICTGITTERVYFIHAADKGSMFPEGLPRLVDGEQAGVFIRHLPWSSRYAPTHFVSINDIITDAIPVVVNRIVNDKEPKAGSYSGTSVFIKSITKDFDAGLYTIKIEDTGSGNSKYYVRLNYYKADGSVPGTSEEDTYSENVEFVRKQNTYKSIFYAQLPIRKIDIRCNGGTTYSYNGMQMFDNAINY